MWIKTNFHMKGWAPRLALKKRPKVIRKWSILGGDVYSPRNDPDPEMIPNPERIPKLTPKWSQPRNDPHFSSCRPRNNPQGLREWWLNMGVWIAFCSSLKCWNHAISFYSYEISNKRKVVVGSLVRYSLDPVSFQWTILAWCNVSNQARRRGGSTGSNEAPLKFDNGGLKYKWL